MIEILSILALATTGSSAVSSVANAVKSVRDTLDKSPVVSDDVRQKLSDLLDEVIGAKQLNLRLVEQVQIIVEEMRQHEEFREELGRYEMFEMPAGSIVWKLRNSHKSGQPLHYLCPNCVQSKKLYILQGDRNYRRCTSCKVQYHFEHQVTSQPNIEYF
jgi:hypothetical protein